MAQLVLQFSRTHTATELIGTSFLCPLSTQLIECIRGKVGALAGGKGAFQWTPGVIAVCIVALQAKVVRQFKNDRIKWLSHAGLSNRESSLATSLDFALSKEPAWLLDMFGCDSRGVSVTKRLFTRENPEGRRAGAVRVALNAAFLEPSSIVVNVDGRPITDDDELRALIFSIRQNTVVSKKLKYSPASRTSDSTALMMTAASDANSLFFRQTTLEVRDYAHRMAAVEAELLEVLKRRAIAATVTEVRQEESELFTASCIAKEETPDIITIEFNDRKSPSHKLAEAPLRGRCQYTGLEIFGPKGFRNTAQLVVRDLGAYLDHLVMHLRDLLAVAVRAFNPPIVDHLYLSLRRYLSAVGTNDGLDAFSLFAHVNGKARYLLDARRHVAVQKCLTNSFGTASDGETDHLGRLIQTEAWYCTSTHLSEHTMSYTDAVVPWHAWCGTPNTWKRPLPGFGGSEIVVYGRGATWAEPVSLGTDTQSVAVCAVYRNDYAAQLKDKFLTVPPLLFGDFNRLADSLQNIEADKL